MRALITVFFWLLLLGGAAYGGLVWYRYHNQPPERSFRTAPAKKGDLVSAISSTGTIEPEEVVDVGAQVAGLIYAFGKDKDGKQIYYRSEVEAGTVLAQIDDTLYAADLAQAEGLLAVDAAGISKSEADLEQLKGKLAQSTADVTQFQAKHDQTLADLDQLRAKLDQATRDWDRAQKLGPSSALSQESFDTYRSAFDSAKANVSSGQAAVAVAAANVISAQATVSQATAAIHSGDAAILQAKANVTRDQASVTRAKKNVTYCTITSPVKGVIIDRRVNIGQTVVSSLNAPSLFLIAKDLKRMRIWVAVNEADIGSIHAGQTVTFTVDSIPNRTFPGKVGTVRLNATMTQNVVTYTVEVEIDNSDNALIPYLTASVHFEVDKRHDVMTVPNAALRWAPPPAAIAPDVPPDEERPHRAGGSGGGQGGGADGGPGGKTPDGTPKPPRMPRAKVWIQDGNFVRPIAVRTGISDGSMTEVQSDKLEDGQLLVIGENVQKTDGTATTNPFAPQNPFARRTTTTTTTTTTR